MEELTVKLRNITPLLKWDFVLFCISALSKVWYPAMMDSSEEVQDVGNLARESGKCPGHLVGIGGSANTLEFNIEFDQYIPGPLPGNK